MRKSAGLVLIMLAALVLINMPSFKGLSIIQLDRSSDLPVGADPGGALGILDLDQGLSGAIVIGGSSASADRYMGTITNNFDFPVELDVTVLIRAVITGKGNPRWRGISIFFDKVTIDGTWVRIATLNYNDFRLGNTEQLRMAEAIVLASGEALVVSLDRDSRFFQMNNIDYFQAEALFTFSGGSTGTENITFDIEPKDDLRKQYFSRSGS